MIFHSWKNAKELTQFLSGKMKQYIDHTEEGGPPWKQLHTELSSALIDTAHVYFLTESPKMPQLL